MTPIAAPPCSALIALSRTAALPIAGALAAVVMAHWAVDFERRGTILRHRYWRQ